MSALDDKDVPSAEQWKDAVTFMTSALSGQIKQAENDLQQLQGPTSFYDNWILWKSRSDKQVCMFIQVYTCIHIFLLVMFMIVVIIINY